MLTPSYRCKQEHPQSGYLEGGAVQDSTSCLRKNVALSVGAAGGKWGAVVCGAASLACHLELASKGCNAGLHIASRCQEVILLVPGEGATQTLHLAHRSGHGTVKSGPTVALPSHSPAPQHTWWAWRGSRVM